MSDKAVFLLKKVVSVAATLLIVNAVLIVFFREVYTASNFWISILLFNLFTAADKTATPFFFQKGREDRHKIQTLIVVLVLFLLPFLVAVPYVEYSLLLKTVVPPEVSMTLWILGTLMIVAGGSTLVRSRVVLGAHSSVRIGIEENHRLVTRGPYRVIRHPIYAGVLFFYLGYTISFSSVLTSTILLLFFVPVVRARMALEEKLLIETFGDEYLEYMKHTKRLIPFVY